MKKFSTAWWLSLRPEQAGKETERIVDAVLRERNRQMSFAYHRLPDARSARGALAAQPADYMACVRGRLALLEVKALAHEYRLPKDRLTQLPTLRKFAHAGALALVLIFHYLLGRWRIVSVLELDPALPSWDLREQPLFESPHLALALMDAEH